MSLSEGRRQQHKVGGEEEDGRRLLVKGFPSWLSGEDKESLLSHFGAGRVDVMPSRGKMVSWFMPCPTSTSLVVNSRILAIAECDQNAIKRARAIVCHFVCVRGVCVCTVCVYGVCVCVRCVCVCASIPPYCTCMILRSCQGHRKLCRVYLRYCSAV